MHFKGIDRSQYLKKHVEEFSTSLLPHSTQPAHEQVGLHAARAVCLLLALQAFEVLEDVALVSMVYPFGGGGGGKGVDVRDRDGEVV
jgi:hypothetical protein